MAGETGSAREEAERLVAAVLAMAGGKGQDENPGGTSAALRDGLGNLGDTLTGLVNQITGAPEGQEPAGRHTTYGWSTGSRECCVCPICRLIAGTRDPNPNTAERLATGAGDMAMGVASLMRGLSAVTSVVKPIVMPPAKPAARPSRPAASPPDPDTAWSAATRTTREPDTEPAPDEDESPWAAATRAEARQAEEAREAARRAEQARAAAEARVAAEAGAAAEAWAAEQAGEARVAAEAREAARRAEAAPVTPPAAKAPRAGQDVWAAATSADAAEVTATGDVAHDDAGDEAPHAADIGRNTETS